MFLNSLSFLEREYYFNQLDFLRTTLNQKIISKMQANLSVIPHSVAKTASQLADTMSRMNNVRSSAGAAQAALETQFRRATPSLIGHLTRFRATIFRVRRKQN
jgi:hypothetical protein